MPNLVEFAARCLLVLLFLPFSALDKLLNFNDAIGQASKAVANRQVAALLIIGGFCVEVFCSLAILTGIADRPAALVLAAYCVITALLWKQFWRTADFKLKGPSAGREVFWDFLKNLSVAGGFLLLGVGSSAMNTAPDIGQQLGSTHPYHVE